jgi:hypothetical protein
MDRARSSKENDVLSRPYADCERYHVAFGRRSDAEIAPLLHQDLALFEKGPGDSWPRPCCRWRAPAPSRHVVRSVGALAAPVAEAAAEPVREPGCVPRSDGVTQLTAIPQWQSWAMAVGIDCMLISVALAQLTATADVKRDIRTVASIMEAGTLIMSAGLNALAFTGGAFDAAHWAQVAFGCFVPAAISGATYILARLTRR